MSTLQSIDTILASCRERQIILKVSEGDKLTMKYPKGALTEEIQADIRARKDEIIRYLKQAGDQSLRWRQIPAVPEAASYILSSAQYRLWIAYKLQPVSVAYNVPFMTWLEDTVDTDLFHEALKAVVARHEILRTVFQEDASGNATQIVLPAGQQEVVLQVQDLRSEANPEARAAAIIAEDMTQPFRLEDGPLFRVYLLQTDTHRYRLYYNMHHIISDGWSSGILVRDVQDCYAARLKGELPAWPELRIQYKDYAAWQQEQLIVASATHREYWLQQLSGELPLFALPSDKARPALFRGHGYAITTRLNPALVDSLRQFARQRQTTLFNVLTAALNALYYRYTGQHDVIIGTPVAGRGHAELEDQIGFYVNTLALRTRFKGEDSFDQLLEQVQTVINNAYAHQDYPFDKLIPELGQQRDMSRSPITDAVIMYHHRGSASPAPDERHNTGDDTEGACAAKLDLHVAFTDDDEQLNMTVTFATDVYTKETIRSFMAHFQQLMPCLLARPELALHQYDYLSDTEKQTLLHTFNDTVQTLAEISVVDAFKAIVAKHGDARALVFEQETWTYNTLDTASNRLAHYLRRKGVQPGDLVPVLIDRSPEMFVAIWGVLKAGAAFAPLDPSYPAERIAYMLSDLKAGLVISHTFYKDILEAEEIPSAVYMDRDWIGIDLESELPVDHTPSPDDLAYVIYTSGSTGKPKGVMLTHRGVINLTHSIGAEVPLREGDGMLQFASFSFDAACFEIFCMLLNGGFLFVPQKETLLSPVTLIAQLVRHQVGIATLPPSFQQTIIADTGSLHTVISAGEPLDTEVATVLQQRGVQVINAYGPTETTVCATITRQPLRADRQVTIGKPLFNTSLYILDENMNLLPTGVNGHLYVGGVQLAKGYLHRPDLTEERFVPHPFVEGGRLYNTGDLARWLPDGNIIFAGRADEQVKVRGYRIELEEVRQALLAIKGIMEVVVGVVPDKNGQSLLAAWVVARGTYNKTVIRETLQQRLPGFMVPSYIIRIEEMPLTPSGKVDKKQLSQPTEDDLESGVVYVPPTTAMQATIVGALAEILGRPHEQIGIEDNFFDIGATSLLLIRLTTLLNERLAVNLQVTSLFEFANVRTLAEHCQQIKAPTEMAVPTADKVAVDEALDMFE